jgi:hypothetical protein
MSLRNTGLVSVVALAVVGATAACGSDAPRGRTGFDGAGGSAAGQGSSGGAGTSGGGGVAGAGYSAGGASGGFILPDGSVQQDTGPLQNDAACAADTRDSTPMKKDIIVVFDTSVSMGCDVADLACDNPTKDMVITTPRIQAVRTAINDFIAAPASADIRVGLNVFPSLIGDQCTADYSQLNVPIAAVSQNGANITQVLGGLTPHANTPTEQVLTGSYKAATDYIAANPGRSVAIVLVTDGIPAACGDLKDGTAAAALAKAAFQASPSILTYVVGIGTYPALDLIALAGSGDQTHYIPTDANVTQKILDLLKAVSTMITCDYVIPTNGKTLDYNFVSVQARVGDGGFTSVPKVSAASVCAKAGGGWYFDVDPSVATPTKITVCTETCDPLKTTADSALQVLIGCTYVASIY